MANPHQVVLPSSDISIALWYQEDRLQGMQKVTAVPVILPTRILQTMKQSYFPILLYYKSEKMMGCSCFRFVTYDEIFELFELNDCVSCPGIGFTCRVSCLVMF